MTGHEGGARQPEYPEQRRKSWSKASGNGLESPLASTRGVNAYVLGVGPAFPGRMDARAQATKAANSVAQAPRSMPAEVLDEAATQDP